MKIVFPTQTPQKKIWARPRTPAATNFVRSTQAHSGLMKENGLTVRPRRRFIATTDSNHDGPIFPDLAEHYADNLNQLWVADITYVAIATGFVYLAAILDAWSRRVVGYAISNRSMHVWRLLRSSRRRTRHRSRVHASLRPRFAGQI